MIHVVHRIDAKKPVVCSLTLWSMTAGRRPAVGGGGLFKNSIIKCYNETVVEPKYYCVFSSELAKAIITEIEWNKEE